MEASGKFRREVADLIGVRKQDDGRIEFADELFQCSGETIGCVGGEERVLDSVDMIQLLARQLIGQRANSLP